MDRIWQISGGRPSRSFVDVFLRHGVALLGPGDAGPWRAGRPDADFGKGRSVRRFAVKPRQGDVIQLRTRTCCIHAVGLFASDEYEYLQQFDDVNGRDLQHARRVRWCPLPTPHDFGHPVFGAMPASFGRARRGEVIEYALRFIHSPPTAWQEAPLPPLPADYDPLMAIPQDVADAVALALDFAGHDLGCRVSEDEMIAHFVVPFLRALGWRPEQIAMKWHNVDVALFSQLPRSPQNCRLLIEVKHPRRGIDRALRQASRYCAALGIAPDILLTDGYRYRLYSGGLDPAPIAYANLLRLKRSAAELFTRLKRP